VDHPAGQGAITMKTESQSTESNTILDKIELNYTSKITLDQLTEDQRQLLIEAVTDDCGTIATGRMRVEYRNDACGEILSARMGDELYFVLI
jgi:hypothetical protein